MAEFCEVMRQARRMCDAQVTCHGCPLAGMASGCAGHKSLRCIASVCDTEGVERIVMDWAAKNPEPRYPTWEKWWKATFPNAEENWPPCKGYFMERKQCCISCDECKKQPIPADIAEKLGIRPVGGENNA